MSEHQSEPQPNPAGFLKSGKHWPFLIVAMLVVHASIMLGTIAFVSAKNDLYVEPDYYAKSMQWDDRRAMLDAPQKMGWTIGISVAEPTSDTDPSRQLSVSITDANNDPIDRALVELELFHPAKATERTNAVLTGTDAGLYQTTLPFATPGFWQAIITIQYQGVAAMIKEEIEIK